MRVIQHSANFVKKLVTALRKRAPRKLGAHLHKSASKMPHKQTNPHLNMEARKGTLWATLIKPLDRV
jgi:hypothetical protein